MTSTCVVNVAATVRTVVDALDSENDIAGVTIVCAGTDGSVALEDVVCADRLLRGLVGARPNISIADSARVALLTEQPYVEHVASVARDAMHAHALASAGFSFVRGFVRVGPLGVNVAGAFA